MLKQCPRCQSEKRIKFGFQAKKQRFKCKECNYAYTVIKRSANAGKEVKKKALQLYLEGMGLRGIGRILKYSHFAVYSWIKTFGEKAKKLQDNKSIATVEIDEMHSYVGKKKTTLGFGLQ